MIKNYANELMPKYPILKFIRSFATYFIFINVKEKGE